MIAYVRRHHLAFLALFVALGGGGAYAASELGGGQIKGFAVNPTNDKGTATGRLARLGGLTLAYESVRQDDGRYCVLVARSKTAGELHTHAAGKTSAGASIGQFVDGQRFDDGDSHNVVSTTFDEGAPDISRQLEGQFTWTTRNGKHVTTSVFHMSAESKRCAFQGTLTAAG